MLAFYVVAAEVTRLKYCREHAVVGLTSEPRYLGCYNLKLRSEGALR